MNLFKQIKKTHFIFAILFITILFAGCIEEQNNLTKNESQKNKILNQQPKEINLDNVLEKYSSEINKCALLEDEYYRNECLINIASTNLDPLVCEFVKVSNPNITLRKSDCFNAVGQKMLDESVCLMAKDLIIKDKCLVFIAIKKQSIELCKNISDSYNRIEMCEKRIKNKKMVKK